MSTRSRLFGRVANTYLNSRRTKHALHGAARVLRGGRRRIEFYYRADDPYSHLLVQALPRLAALEGVSIDLIPVAEASIGAHPAPDMLAAHALREAPLLAEAYDLRFPQKGESPPADRIRRAHAVLLLNRSAEEQLEVAQKVGEAVWFRDGEALAALVEQYGAVSGERVDSMLERNHARLERAGHYQSGMLHYGGDWYWGIDRLRYLEDRLHEEGVLGEPGRKPGAASGLQTGAALSVNGSIELEMYVSFRSPYSGLSLPMIADLVARYPVDLRLKPVLPMVMRGLPVPKSKRIYIVNDAKREADRLGIPFGNLCDPLGRGIGYCLAVFFECAEPRGLGLTFTRSAMQGIWSEALDVGHVADLKRIAERVGISGAEVDAALESDKWEERAAENRQALTDLGLWGVPSFRLGEYATWGQDRIFLLEREIKRLSGLD